MRLSIVSEKGDRAENEDCAGEVKARGIECIVVADGLGGHKSGAVASRIGVETVLNKFKEEPRFSGEAIEKYIEYAHEAIFEKSRERLIYSNMGATIAILLIKGKTAIYGNVGDTRIYHFTDNIIDTVSEDHSLAYKQFTDGQIEYEDIRTSPDQNKLLGAVGLEYNEVYISEEIPIDGNTAFLVCTDGWWELINEEQMENTLKESNDTKEWINAMREIVVDFPHENKDNFTAAAIFA